MIKKPVAAALAIAGLIVVTAGGLRYAESTGAIGDETARRAIQILIGLVLAAYANLMPKQIGSLRSSPEAYRRSQSVLRFGGWSFTVAGLAHASFWALAPVSIANIGATVAVAGALLLTLAYASWSFTACRRGRTGSIAR